MKQKKVVFFHNFQEINSDLNAVKILKVSNTYLNFQANWEFKTIWMHLLTYSTTMERQKFMSAMLKILNLNKKAERR